MNANCPKQKKIALLAGGELGQRQAARVRSHAKGCATCRPLLDDLGALRRLAAASLLDDAAEFQSVRGLVASRLAASPGSRRPSARPIWAVLAPLAATLAVAGVLLLSSGGDAAWQQGSRLLSAEVSIKMAPVAQDKGLVLTVLGESQASSPNQWVAVSERSSDFADAELFEIRGDRWVDSMPTPRAGQAYFYKVD